MIGVIIGIIVVLVLLGVGLYFFMYKPNDLENDMPTLETSTPTTATSTPTTATETHTAVTETPINCAVGDWSEWSRCDNNAIKTRSREITVQPYAGGEQCPTLTEQMNCSLSTHENGAHIPVFLDHAETFGDVMKVDVSDPEIKQKLSVIPHLLPALEMFKENGIVLTSRDGLVEQPNTSGVVFFVDLGQEVKQSRLEMVVYAPTPTGDSVFLQINDDAPVPWHLGSFSDRRWRSIGNLKFKPGINKIIISHREPVLIYRIRLL